MKELIHLKTNPEVLKWARNSIALSKSDAAGRTGISISRLEQIENGKYPDVEELKLMAKAYKRTIATLLLQSVPTEKPLPKDRRTVNSEVLNVFSEKTVFAVRKARALVNSLIELKLETNQINPVFSIKADLNDSPETLAAKLRKIWQLDEYRNIENNNQSLEAYIELIESFGIAVFQISLPQDNIRGFSLTDESMPVIVIKGSSEPVTAKIFTLFHELGHIILNDGGICDITFDKKAQRIELWCNAFASEVLVPAEHLLKLEIVRKYASNNAKIWQKKDLVEVANFFHIGPLAMLRCLLKNNLTTSEFYNEKHESWNKPSFGYSSLHEGRNLPKEVIRERGRTYLNLAFQAFDQNKIDLKDLSDFLGIRLSYIPKTRLLLTV